MIKITEMDIEQIEQQELYYETNISSELEQKCEELEKQLEGE